MNEEEYFEITHEDGLYIIDDDQNPTLLVARGETYVFDIDAEGHPFWIKTEMVSGQESAYNNGVENNGIEVGELTFTVPSDAPNQLYYACEFHETMQGEILVLDKEEMTRAKLVKMFRVLTKD